jgi:hypothetical protein
MRKIIKYKLLMVIAIAMVLPACKKDFLEKFPPTALTPELALATETDLQTALMGAYAGLRTTDLFGRSVPVFGDLNADNAYVSLTNSGRYTLFNTNNFTIADGNVVGMWRGAYTAILRANNIINANVAANTNVNQYKGEAYAIRALCYWYLVQYFAKPYTDDPNALGVPIVLKYDPNTVATDKPTRNKVSEVYTQILADLNQAYTLMTIFTNSTQFSKYAAKALQAKVYLCMGDKTNAKTAALDVINNSGFTVVPSAGYVTYWGLLTPRTDKVETLFEVSSNSTANNGFDALANIYNQAGYGDLLPSSDFFPVVIFSAPPSTPTGLITATGTVNISGGVVTGVNIVNAGTGYTAAPTVTFSAPSPTGAVTATGTATIASGSVTSVTITNPGTSYSELIPLTDIRRSLYTWGPRGGIPAIFANVKYPGTFGGEISDTKILRLSDVYLIAAEASLPGNETDAKTYANYITSRRGAAAIASTGAQLLEDILNERRKELAFEGDRYLDLQRLKRDINRSQNFPSANRTIPYSNFRRLFPIPQAELDANPNIRSQQNPGW